MTEGEAGEKKKGRGKQGEEKEESGAREKVGEEDRIQ